MVQYLLTPAPTVIERAADYFEREDPAAIARLWRQFDYIWIASPLAPDAVASLSRLSSKMSVAGLYYLHPSTAGITPERIDLSN
jgi:hypothetical protein